MNAALFAMSIALATAAPAASQSEFKIGPVALTATLPTGYCLPEGDDATAAQMVASADNVNATLLTVNSCTKSEAWKDYYLVKVPVQLIPVTITNAELQAQVGPALEQAIDSDQINKKASERTTETLGTEVQVKGQIKGYGKDETCLYIGGIMDAAVPKTGLKYTLAVTGCMTVVGGKMLTIYRYSPGKSEADILRLRSATRAFAQGIRVKAAGGK
ncbi:hypothetical protein ABS767_09965 [Sphingomonas sp. ST-64]|uniref:Uncharacterized protein n=1 Tax=Sphingomonas plantiphila TaxID=3163295 RepID=A0ABW8YLY1_9SPHN